MTRTMNSQLWTAGRNNTLKVLLIGAVITVFAVSFYAFQPLEEDGAYNVAPKAAPTPRKVKSVAVGDVNGDGMPERSKGKRKFKPQSPESNGSIVAPNAANARTETVNNNETLKTNRRLNVSGAQDGSGTDNANMRRKRTTHGIVTDNVDPEKLGKTTSNGASYIGAPGDKQGIRRKGPTIVKHKRYRK